MARPLYYLCLFVAHAGSTPGTTKSTTKIECGFVLLSLDFKDKVQKREFTFVYMSIC